MEYDSSDGDYEPEEDEEYEEDEEEDGEEDGDDGFMDVEDEFADAEDTDDAFDLPDTPPIFRWARRTLDYSFDPHQNIGSSDEEGNTSSSMSEVEFLVSEEENSGVEEG